MRAKRLNWILVSMMSILLVWAAGCKKPQAEDTTKKKGPAPCPTTFDAKQNTDGLTCVCAKGKDKGRVWGTDLFMTGSATCAAAIHAGAITKTKGGKVKIKYAGGCKAYKGTTKNGITSKFWSGNDASFFFAGHSSGTCDQ
jgi:LCCL domain